MLMKILFCLGSMNKGGAERVVANLSNLFSQKYDVSIVITSSDLSAYSLSDNIRLYHLDDKKNNDNFIAKNIKRSIKLRKILKDIKPDIILSFLPEPTFRLMVSKIFIKMKVIISVRNDPNIEYNNFVKKLLVKLLYSKADGFVFQTEDAKKWFSNKIQSKSIIIPNPINDIYLVDRYTGKRKDEIVTVGRLTEQKNHYLLIDSFKEIHDEYPSLKLKIIGDGNLKNDLINYTKNKKLENSVFFKGNVENVKDEIYKSKIFVLSSDYEGMPNALMEAMALGIPCISTNCPIGGPKFLINNNINGVLVEVNNKDMMVKAIKKVLLNADLANKISANSNKDMKKYNSVAISEKWEKYIKGVYLKK